MISVEEARRIVLENLPQLRVEPVTFTSAFGRVLAESLTAAMDVPPFPRAAMDGFALRSSDVSETPAVLRCVGEVKAGEGMRGAIGAGEAASIMTGAPVPEGADAVQMVEQTRKTERATEVAILKPVRPGENIAPQGSEARRGEVVLEAGRYLGAAEMAVLATFGFSAIPVYARPSVALLATGDELVEVDDTPDPHQIRNSNTHSLIAQLRSLGLEGYYLGIAPDDREELRRRMRAGLEFDVLILSGGVSMGEYDFVKEIFQELGLETLFTRVAMKPGKPTVFARSKNKLVFGLPGNPVSTFVAFENFVRPALGRLCGFRAPDLPRVRGVLLSDVKQVPGRTAFLPARADWSGSVWQIRPLRWKGSADIIGFSQGNAMLIFPRELDHLKAGDEVEAMLLSDFFQRT